ncbi:hypothetical protein [Legionella yabuuchiae]|uniref:hypothetical protein n=1 Tax=Legionella yabuuchiae TaxID=376727 RepID=UPI0010544A70|nr:hypothetical protein [Legionella yabuuchiae]
MITAKDKIANPVKFYTTPREVELDDELSVDEKIKVLTNWLDDINLRITAESENMPAHEETRFYMAEVERLLHKYQHLQAEKKS